MEAPRDPGRATAALAAAGRAAAATCGVLSVALVTFVLWRSATLLALLYVAAMMAVVLDRPVAALVRRGLGRAWALALVLSGVGATMLAAIVVAFGPLVAQVRGLAAAAPGVVDSLRGGLAGRLGGILDGTPLAAWFHDALSRGAGALAGGVYGAAGGVANAAGALATVLAMAVLLLSSGPDLVQRAIGALPPVRAERPTRSRAPSSGQDPGPPDQPLPCRATFPASRANSSTARSPHGATRSPSRASRSRPHRPIAPTRAAARPRTPGPPAQSAAGASAVRWRVAAGGRVSRA